MKIGLDLRFLKQKDYYSDFVLELSKKLIQEYSKDNFSIFLNLEFSNINLWENTKNIIVNNNSLFDKQIKFKKILDKEKLDLTIFFNYDKPLNYKCNYIMFISDLEEFHFTPKKNLFKKHFDNYLLSQNSKNANKIICFNEKIKSEINDKLNIFEENIYVITPFFNYKKIETNDIKIDIKTKYNIKWDYFIYYFWSQESKNLDRIIDIFEAYKKENPPVDLSLVILDNNTIKDINLRKKIVNKNLSDKIFFIWEVENKEKELFFKNSKGILYPVLYSIFPFELVEAINYNTPIISSKLKNIENIFKNKIKYFNQTDIQDMYVKIFDFSKENILPNYEDIIKEYNISKTITDLKNIIK